MVILINNLIFSSLLHYEIEVSKDTVWIGEPVFFTYKIINATNGRIDIYNWGDMTAGVDNPQTLITYPDGRVKRIITVIFSPPLSVFFKHPTDFISLMPQDSISWVQPFLEKKGKYFKEAGSYNVSSRLFLEIEAKEDVYGELLPYIYKEWKVWKRESKFSQRKKLVKKCILSLNASTKFLVKVPTDPKAYEDYLRYKKKEMEWEEFIEKHCDSPYAPHVLMQEALKNEKEALKILTIMTEKYPDFFWAKRVDKLMGDYYWFRKKDKEKAKFYYLSYIKRYPHSLDSYLLLHRMKKWEWIE